MTIVASTLPLRTKLTYAVSELPVTKTLHLQNVGQGNGLPVDQQVVFLALVTIGADPDGQQDMLERHAAPLAAADLDGDGRLDLAVTHSVDEDVRILYGQSGGGFAAKDGFAGWQVRHFASLQSGRCPTEE